MPAEHMNLKFKYENVIKIIINPFLEYLGLIIFPIKPSAGLFILIKSRDTIPLKKNLCAAQHIFGNCESFSDAKYFILSICVTVS
jgi:hypothetical protein